MEDDLIVAFFSDGPFAAMAALLSQTGLVALGASPIGLALNDLGTGRRPVAAAVDELLGAIATCDSRDVLLALPMSLLDDARIRAAVDIAVSVGPRSCGVPSPPPASTAWHLACSNDLAGRPVNAFAPRLLRRMLPLRLPAIHPSEATFMHDGVPCAPPVRDALRLVAILQALATDPGVTDVEACMRELLLGDVPDGHDLAVDRLRTIADRLDAIPDRHRHPMRRRTARDARGRRPEPGRVSAKPGRLWPDPGPPGRWAGRRH